MRSAFDALIEGLRPQGSVSTSAPEQAPSVLDDDPTEENLDQLAEICGGQSFTFTTIELYGNCPCEVYATHVGIVEAEDGTMAMIGYCDRCAQAVGPALERLKTK